MKKLFKGIGSAGLTLVELIISMAILAVVGIAIGGAMYASSRSYTRASSEVNVQQEAQVASNLICDWLIDATAVNPVDEDDISKGFTEGEVSQLVIYHPDGDKIVKIIVALNGSDLEYTAYNWDPDSPEYKKEISHDVLATNVSGVNFYTTFGKDRNVRISIDFEVNERTYRAVTDTTSRSYDFVSTGGGTLIGKPIIRFGNVCNNGGTHIVLEPGQTQSSGKTYTFYVYLDNCDPDPSVTTLTCDTSGLTHTQVVSCTWNSMEKRYDVVVASDTNAKGAEAINFTASNAGGTDKKAVSVRIRRTNDCRIGGTTVTTDDGQKTWIPTSGESGKKSSSYVCEIDLGITNFANEAVLGGKYDEAPYNYVDPSEVDVFFMQWNGSKYVSYSGATYSVVPGEIPQLKVSLSSDLDSDLYVVVVAKHSGIITGNANDKNSPSKGCSVLTANNKTGCTYGDSSRAYCDWIRIAGKPSHNPFINVGGGVKRGTPACMLAEYDPTFQANLIADIKKAYSWADNNKIDSGTFLYTTTMYYRPKTTVGPDGQLIGTGEFQPYVIYTNDNLSAMWKEASRRLRDCASSLFTLNTGYEIYLEFTVSYGGSVNPDLKYRTTGDVPAATPYVWNPATGKFRQTASESNRVTFDSSSNDYWVPVFIDGVTLNNQKVGCVVEVYDSAKKDWVTVPGAVYQVGWAENKGQTGQNVSEVYFENDSTKHYPVGQYLENTYKYSNVNLEIVHLDMTKLTSGVTYRINFTTQYVEFSNAHPYGPLPYGGSMGLSALGLPEQNYDGSNGGKPWGYVSDPVKRTYELPDYLYFTKK